VGRKLRSDSFTADRSNLKGSPIKSVTPNYTGKTVLKLGIFPKIPIPEWESFASQRHEWYQPLEGRIQYKTKSGGEKMES
jgi:hypothetical protein